MLWRMRKQPDEPELLVFEHINVIDKAIGKPFELHEGFDVTRGICGFGSKGQRDGEVHGRAKYQQGKRIYGSKIRRIPGKSPKCRIQPVTGTIRILVLLQIDFCE
jgi:hypothetical protein